MSNTFRDVQIKLIQILRKNGTNPGDVFLNIGATAAGPKLIVQLSGDLKASDIEGYIKQAFQEAKVVQTADNVEVSEGNPPMRLHSQH